MSYWTALLQAWSAWLELSKEQSLLSSASTIGGSGKKSVTQFSGSPHNKFVSIILLNVLDKFVPESFHLLLDNRCLV
jgi:hypothetical protein